MRVAGKLYIYILCLSSKKKKREKALRYIAGLKRWGKQYHSLPKGKTNYKKKTSFYQLRKNL